MLLIQALGWLDCEFFFFFILKCFCHVVCYLDNKGAFAMDTKLGVKEKQKSYICYPLPISIEGQGPREVLPKGNDQDEGRLSVLQDGN